MSWSSIPINKEHPRYAYWISKMNGQIKYLESNIVHDFGINLYNIPNVNSGNCKEFEIVYPTIHSLKIKESIIE